MDENDLEDLSYRRILITLRADARSPVTSILAAATVLKQDIRDSGTLSEETEFLLDTILKGVTLLNQLFSELKLD